MVEQLKKGPKTKQEWIAYSSELENQLQQVQNDQNQAKEETNLLTTAIYEIDLKQLQTALASEQEQLATIFEAQQDIVLLYGPDMNVRRVNSAFQETYGFDPVGMNVREIVQRVSCRNLDGQPLDWSRQPTPQALKGEKVSRACFLVKRRDGRDQIVETSASPIWRGNDITGSVTVWHDITELQQIRQTLEEANTTLQNQAEELEVQTEELKQQTDELISANQKLAESERKYALLFGKSAVASALTKLPEKTFVDVNEAFEKLFGYSRKELAGKTSLEVGIARPEEHAVTVAEVEKKGLQHDAEKHFRTQSGAEIIAMVNVDSLEIGGKQYVITTIQDITERKQAEVRLAYQADLIENVQDAIIVCDKEFRITYWNQAAEQMYGWSQAEALGQNATQLLRSELAGAELKAAIAQGTQTGLFHGEIVHYARDGRRLVIETQTIYRKDASGLVESYLIANRDVTGRHQADERIQRQNRILTGINRIFQKALTCQTEEDLGQVCLAVAEEVTASRFGFIGEINPQTGKLDDLAISTPGWEACRMQDPTGQEHQVPTNFTNRGIHGLVLLESQSLFTNDPASHFNEIGVPPGHPPLQAFLGVPLLNGEKPIGMVGLGNRVGGYGPEELRAVEALAPAIVQAISSKRAEDELRASREQERLRAAQLEAVMEALPIGMAITDDKGGNFQSNRAFEQTWEGPRPKVNSIKDYKNYKAWWADSGEEVKPEEWASAQAVQKGETVIGQFFEIRRFDGTSRYVLNSASPVKDASGKIRGSAVAIQDITSLHEAEQSLKEANVLLEQRVRERTAELEKSLQTERVLRQQLIQTEKFAALARLVGSVAHEINNPLQTVKNCLFLVKDETNPTAREEELSMAVSEIRRISDLVNLMRQTYRPSSPQSVDFNLIDLFSRVKALLEPQFRQLNVVWSFEKNRDCITIHGKPDQIQQVILNICLNALDAMSDTGGILNVSVKRLARVKKVQITFHDTGPGICKENLDQIFEPFYTTKAKGTGLGLAICYEIVKNHEGEIIVESEPGGGATFKIWLPES